MSSYFWRSIKGYIPIDPGARLLEIGCGAGFCLLALRDNGYTNYLGIDIDKTQIEIAKRLGAEALHVPASEQPAFFSDKNEFYDCVIAFDVLEHIPVSEQLNLLEKIRSCLKPGGKFICQVPNALSPIASFQRYVDWTHTSAFTPDSIEFLFRSAGLVPQSFRSSFDPEPRRSKLTSILVYLLKHSLRFFVRTCWRLVLISELGLRRGVSTDITPNFICVATKQ